MARQLILWTVLPAGWIHEGPHAGRLRVRLLVSPRLTPESPEEGILEAFEDFLNWPGTLEHAEFRLRIGGDRIGLVPLGRTGEAGEADLSPDPDLWRTLLPPDTPVAGFDFPDMSRVNLRSYPVRNILGFLRRHYGRLASQATSTHPTLLPWKDAHPDLKGMLSELGTRTRHVPFGRGTIEVPIPGFSRFFDESTAGRFEDTVNRLAFGPEGPFRAPVPGISAPEDGLPKDEGEAVRRTLPADWWNPRPGGPDGPLSQAPGAALMDMFASADEYHLYQANRFYRRKPPTAEERAMRRPDFQNLAPPPPVPEFDFHRKVAAWGDYPGLLQRLGLLLEFALEDDGPVVSRIEAGGGTGFGRMQVEVTWAGGTQSDADVRPQTAWHADRERFVTRPRSEEMNRGLLVLDGANDGWGTDDRMDRGRFDRERMERGRGRDPSPYDVYQVDPDGAALKTAGFTLTAQRLVGKSLSLRQRDGEVSYTTGNRQSVAALRSAGLGVSRHDRAARVAADAAAAALKNGAVESGNGNQVVLFAEDVVSGYRVDVLQVPDPAGTGQGSASGSLPDGPNGTLDGRWRSLCARTGRYRLIATGDPLDLPDDEGQVAGPSTSSSDEEGVDPDDHYLHESLFRWTGWSLAAPRPGLAIRDRTEEGTQLQAEEPTRVLDRAEHGTGIEAEFRVPKGSLPRLRFGAFYRFRARLVDATGGSLAHDDPTLGETEHATDPVGYWRFEPVDPPAMVHRHRVSEGESLERLVVRSNYDMSAGEYLEAPAFSEATELPASRDFEYRAQCERHLVPPKSSQQQCEHHGMFDPFFADPERIREGYRIAAREAGSLYDAAPGSEVELVTPSALEEVASTTSVPPAMPGPDNPVGERLSGGQYIVRGEARVRTPYLPDAAAAGVALRAQPGHSIPGVTGEMDLGPSCAVRRAPNDELVLLVANANDWPDQEGFRLIVSEREASISELPCTESFVDDGAPTWNEDDRTLTLHLPKGRIARLLYASFVHPAAIGTLGIPAWCRSPAEREFVRKMAMVGASWMITPFRPLTLVHATQQPVCLPEFESLRVNRQVGEHHADLYCRRIRLHGPSTGKFEIEAEWHEWVDDLERDAPERVLMRGQLGEVHLAENHDNEVHLHEAIAAQIVDPARPHARPDRHELGDTRFRLVEYRLRATTRFREYLPPSLNDDVDQVTRLGPVAEGYPVALADADDPGAPVLPDPSGSEGQTLIPASAPPDAPRVLYTVPTFRWARQKGQDSETVVRRGNGLRVWLDRPWFSSGDGELLGVVLFGDGKRFTDIPARMQSLVTQWGMDPIWDSALPRNRTRVSDFPTRIHHESVRLQERPNDDQVTVVGHRVHWDPERKLWFCDIELDPGVTYMPFVRLALVRYQPNALHGQKVSQVVLGEFAQVLPRRRATLTRHPRRRIAVALQGFAPQAGSMQAEPSSLLRGSTNLEKGRNRAEMVLQSREKGFGSDLDWKDERILSTGIVGADSAVSPGTGGIVSAGSAVSGASAAAAASAGGAASARARGTSAPVESAPTRRAVELRTGQAVTLSSEVDLGRLATRVERESSSAAAVSTGGRVSVPPEAIEINPAVISPLIWSGSGSLPAPDGKERRIMIREFERYFTDRTVPERKGGRTLARRVIEERLVYAATFEV